MGLYKKNFGPTPQTPLSKKFCNFGTHQKWNFSSKKKYYVWFSEMERLTTYKGAPTHLPDLVDKIPVVKSNIFLSVPLQLIPLESLERPRWSAHCWRPLVLSYLPILSRKLTVQVQGTSARPIRYLLIE